MNGISVTYVFVGVHKSDHQTPREREGLAKALAQVTPSQEAAIKTGSGIADLGSITFVSCATGSSPPISGMNIDIMWPVCWDTKLIFTAQSSAERRDQSRHLSLHVPMGKI